MSIVEESLMIELKNYKYIIKNKIKNILKCTCFIYESFIS